MTAAHPDLHAFADGELDAAAADAVRAHLGTCAACQQGLHEILQLDLLVEQQPVPLREVKEKPARGRLAPVAAGVMGLAAAATIALVSYLVLRPQPLPPNLTGPRHLDARVSWSAADAWRPYEAVRGGAQTEAVPLAMMASLEKNADQAALAGAWLLNGEPARARALLEKLDRSVDVLSDLAAVALAEGRPDEAIELAQVALDTQPRHPRALWNKALAARALGFTALAADTWRQVAELNEPGWANEARTQQSALQAIWQRERDTFQQVLDAAAAMVLEGKPMPVELVNAGPSTARTYLAYALCVAPDRASAEAFLPMAAAIDALFGGTATQDSVRLAASADFAKRAPSRAERRAFFVDFFRSLVGWGPAAKVSDAEPGLGPEKSAVLLAQAMREKRAADLLLFLPLTGSLPKELELYAESAKTVGDPWFVNAVQLERGKAALGAGQPAEAERLWLELAKAAPKLAPYRTMQAFERLALLYNQAHRAADAQVAAFSALELARSLGELGAQLRLLSTLGDAARFRGLSGLAVAALEERALRMPEECEPRRYLEEGTAALEVGRLAPARARKALERAASCGQPLSIVGAFSFADVMRLEPKQGDLDQLMATLTAVRASRAADDEQRIIADHVEGRARLDSDRVAGEALLRKAIEGARKLQSGSLAQKMSVYGFGLLRVDAAARQDFGSLFSLSAEELGHPLPERCVLVVEVQDERVAAAGRSSRGILSGEFSRISIATPHREGLETAEMARAVAKTARAASEGCASLEVYASFPLHGRSGWLPDDLAWSFATGLPARPATPGRWVVVSDVATPAALGLKQLSSWSAGVKVDDAISGAQATPERVLAAMREASFVEIDAHGVVNTGSADTAALTLAQGADGYSLSAAKVSADQFPHHPVVLLGACRAATVAPYIHVAWSLPLAFAQAGARAVIAAPVDLPDSEARTFFGRLTARLARGESPAVALRDERVQWLGEGRPGWVRAVLVFE